MQPSILIRQIANSLAQVSENPDVEAEIILCHILNISREEIFLLAEISLGDIQQEKLTQMIESRLKHMPLQYLTGYKWFHGHKFTVNDHTFIPRDDTEIMVESAINFIQERLGTTKAKEIRVLDLCTGSGAIIISLVSTLLDLVNSTSIKFEFLGAEISEKTAAVARENLQNILPKLPENCSVEIVESDLFENLTGKFDLIISNPPYIPETDRDTWQKELDFEPQIALTSGLGGMDVYEEVIRKLPDSLKSEGVFMGEIHPENYSKMKQLAAENNYKIFPIQGLGGEIRFISLTSL